MPTAKRARTSSAETKVKKTNINNSGTGQQAVNLEEAIRLRAYELYRERGGTDGHAQDDWLRAEAEVIARLNQHSV